MIDERDGAVRLKIAIQRSGRLAEDTRVLLERCGLRLTSSRDRLFARADGMPIDILLVRDDDIPAFVASGVCDAGVVGLNIVSEMIQDQHSVDDKGNPCGKLYDDDDGQEIAVKLPLRFGYCRLDFAIPSNKTYLGSADLSGKRIATSHPRLVRRWLRERNIDARVLTMQGSVEIAPRLGLADAVCDLVATGGTLESNGLRQVDTLLRSEAVLVARRFMDENPNAQIRARILDKLCARMLGVVTAEGSRYIMLHAPRNRLDHIKQLLPGSKSPTVLNLAGNDHWVAVHAVCREDVFWDTVEMLREAGAAHILVLPIQKMLD